LSEFSVPILRSPSWQHSFQGSRVRPTNPFVEFREEEIEQSIPDRFDQIVRSYPSRIAVKSKGQVLTYAALNHGANWVARTILAERGERQEPVALLLEHGAPAVVAMLGVLKAGKFYVPLDPSHPDARTSYILEDTQAGLIVTNSRNLPLARRLARGTAHLINLDELDSSHSPEGPGLPISPDALAYIIYTSGATGQPKGVIQNHRNVLHKAMEYTNSVHVCADDRLALFYSPSTSGAVRDIFSALLNGAALFPFALKEEGLSDLAGWLIREEITIYNSVATVFRHFISTLTGEERFPKLRLVHVGSETIYKRDVELYQTHFSEGCIFVANLGSTEVSPIRQYFADKETRIAGSTVPAGYAVKDTEVLILDEDGREVGPNHIGEIAVRSRYLSQGYWRSPELTRAAFLPDPEGGDKRIYRTGDLGRMLSDGCLEHLGRKDFQVKIRGHRVEVAEIELALLDHLALKEAVVLAREGRPGDAQLVAYVVSAAQPAPTVSELRSFLSERLPDYMVPSTFVLLEALPLTPSGKVDRRVLPAPERARPGLAQAFVAPRTPAEKALAGFYAEALGLGRVGAHDNFFDLGGHSLLASQVMSRVHAAFQVELSVNSLFEAPTVAELAERIEIALWLAPGAGVGAGDQVGAREEGEL